MTSEPSGPAQPYSRAERLMNLLMALRRSRAGLDRDQIRAQVRGYDTTGSDVAFERMFERDKDQLRALGVPVVTLTDAGGVATGYRIEGQWTLRPLDLDPAELALLGLAARLWQGADLAPAATNALRKVEARLGMRSTPGSAVPVAGLAVDSPALPDLIEACAHRRGVVFGYAKPGSPAAAQRHVQPWAVVGWHGHWYLVGFDTDRGAQRVFRASRIVGGVRTDPDASPYEVPRDFDARTAVGRFADRNTMELEVAVAPGAAATLRRSGRLLGMLPDGADLLALPVPDLAAGVSSVLAQVPRTRIVGPPDALAEARRQIDAVLTGQSTPPQRASRAHPQQPTRRQSGSAQFERLLALVPWLAANSGVSVDAAAAHFAISPQQLLADLGSIITSGVDDWTLFDIQYWDDDGVIRVIDALELAEPLTLSPDEGFALLAALESLAAVPGGHDRAALQSVQRALQEALGGQPAGPAAVAVRVDLPDDVVDPIEAARAGGRALELTYLGAVRDEVTERVVDPVAVVVIDGYAYLRAYCRRAEGMRLFRLDRILQARVSPQAGQPVTEAAAEVEPMAVTLASTGRSVVVDVAAGSTLLDRHPTTRRWALPDGWVRAELPVGDYAWAEQLVLGGAGQVVLREPGWLSRRIVADARAARSTHDPGEKPGTGTFG